MNVQNLQDVAVGVVLVETENREVRFLVEAGFPVMGAISCQLGLLRPKSGVAPDSPLVR
jgi:hypothetical protein